MPNYSLLLLFLLPMQTIDKRPYKWSLTATETLWRGRYGNCDKGYYVDLPPAVVAHASLPPNPNHGFLISASNPQSIDQVTFDQGRIIGVEDEYNSMEMPNPRAQLEWEIRNTPGTRLIRMYGARFHGLAAAEASYQSPVDGKPQLTFELIAFRSDIVYTFRLITDRAHYAKDFLLYKRMKEGFQIYPIPPGPCTNP